MNIAIASENCHNRTGVELKRMVAVVERLEDRLPSTLNRLSASAVGPERAQTTLSSAHRAKGLECDSLQVAADFLNLCDADLEAEHFCPFDMAIPSRPSATDR
jgi:hypothetical protein